MNKIWKRKCLFFFHAGFGLPTGYMDNKPMCGKMRTALLVPQHASVTANLPHAIVDIMANLTNNND